MKRVYALFLLAFVIQPVVLPSFRSAHSASLTDGPDGMTIRLGSKKAQYVSDSNSQCKKLLVLQEADLNSLFVKVMDIFENKEVRFNALQTLINKKLY